MPTEFRSTSVAMKDDRDNPRLVSKWALPASVAAHLLIAALVIFGLPLPFFEAEAPSAVNVDLVPPPKPEEAKAEPPPPPEPEKPEEKPPETPPAGDKAARPAVQPFLNPVFQFGEKDAGPRLSPDGNSARDGTPPPAGQPEPDRQEPAETPALAASKSPDKAPEAAEKPTSAPVDGKPTETARQEELEESGRLSSHTVTGDVLATTAIGDVPRGVRAGRLCVTELRERMRNAVPPYYPDLLPSFRLGEGTVIDARSAAFRMAGDWYDLSYRCEVDNEATKVLAFDFHVGNRVPPGEWQRRGLPVR